MKIISFLVLIISLSVFAKSNSFEKEKQSSLKIMDAYIKEVYRLDSDGLLPRANRKLSWDQIANKLSADIRASKTKMELGRVFQRLDSAYTNLHARINLNDEYNFNTEGRPMLAVTFRPETINEDGRVPKYLISNVRKEHFINLEPSMRPKVSDELIAINNIPIKNWADENFEFCKFPLRSQCETEFFDNFRKGNLSWYRRQPLTFTLLRDGKKSDYQIPVFAAAKSDSNDSDPLEACSLNKTRYPGFEMVYQGHHACAFENKSHPNVTILRIRSFRYKEVEGQIEIDQTSKEAKHFADLYWSKKISTTKHLIIDVVENGGGQAVVYWVKLFLDQDFQDQWVQFKKTKELEDPEWRNNAFYNEPGKEKIYQDLKKSPKWAEIKEGEFIPAMPQFCISDTECLTKKWQPQFPDKFKGHITILTDPWCISSCTGFAWTMKYYLKDRVKFAGLPESGDSTYSRSYIEASFIDKAPGYKLEVFPRAPLSRPEVSKDAFFRSAISTSRSTDEDGNIVSGVPMKVDYFIAPKWDEDVDEWVGRMIGVVLNRR
ncbi:hypothetical protein CIK05_11895 [Bdellovibrio sp. qaytius]|nr:hypothetical protein CIK05_11895 [Bdellovibrio sp. qaytius]